MTSPLLPFPRLVLRMGFAGSQKLTEETHPGVTAKLIEVFEAVAQRMAEIAPGSEVELSDGEPRISCFYSKEKPVLRLITGLCQGGDHLSWKAMETLQSNPHVIPELAAVIPFDLPVYRASRPLESLPEFDRQAERCSYILALDGRYEKPSPDTALAKNRRARAYRAQAALLLRQADVLLIAADPDQESKAGGAMETVRSALEFDLPVVFFHTVTGKISLIEPGEDFPSILSNLAIGNGDWATTLRTWVISILADPDVGNSVPHSKTESGETVASHGDHLLTEFFKSTDTPPTRFTSDGTRKRRETLREHLWGRFEGWFRVGLGPKTDPKIAPYDLWRNRSVELNYHYAGLYRGAFLLNYGLAALAVLLATLSLVLVIHSHNGEDHASSPPIKVATSSPLAEVATEAENGQPHHSSTPPWLFPSLLILGVAKLSIVTAIYRNTHGANHGDWNDKAVDYRYLAERLRTLYYLPRIGSFQPPMAAPPNYASRVVRQSAVDWLLDAIVRSVSPAELKFAQREACNFPDSRAYEVTMIRLNPLEILTAVRDDWIREQAVYHDRNSRTMDRIHTCAEALGRFLNFSVIVFVGVDVLIVSGLLINDRSALAHTLHGSTPWLVFLAGVLPAAVASLNGIRFQSECRRLAERSGVLRTIIAGHQTLPLSSPAVQDGSRFAAADELHARIQSALSDPNTDPGSWSLEILRLSESVANVFVKEVAEWSVLYAKEVPEP